MLFRFTLARPGVDHLFAQLERRRRAAIGEAVAAIDTVLIDALRVAVITARRSVTTPPTAALGDDDVVGYVRPFDRSHMLNSLRVVSCAAPLPFFTRAPSGDVERLDAQEWRFGCGVGCHSSPFLCDAG